MKYIRRKLQLAKELERKSIFLLGPRQTGKSSLIEKQLDNIKLYDLLDSEVFLKLSNNPKLIEEEIQGREDSLVVIDEVQKLPSLLDEVHRLIEKKKINFLLSGSSARKLKSKGVNLLGGRARTKYLHPLSFIELKEEFDLLKALTYGLIPSIYFSDDPQEDLKSYVGDYLQQEIAAESLVRKVPAFSRFLQVAAFSNSEIINFTNIANDAQIPRTTIYEYFQILNDTLIGHELKAWKKTIKRKPIVSSKFYFFDIGVVNSLKGLNEIKKGSKEFGDAFESYIFHELQTFVDYQKKESLHYWRSNSGFEVDFILDEKIAIEIKAKKVVSEKDLKGLKALREEETTIKSYYLVTSEDENRIVDGIQIIGYQEFLKRLWNDDIY